MTRPGSGDKPGLALHPVGDHDHRRVHPPQNAQNVADNVDTLVRHREQRRPKVKEECRAAIFYSVTSTQAGLQGIELGTHLIKQAVTRLQAEFSAMKSYPRSPPSPAHCHQPTNCDRL